MHNARRVEIAEPLCNLVQLGYNPELVNSQRQDNDSDGTRQVRETPGCEFKYWMMLPKSTQS